MKLFTALTAALLVAAPASAQYLYRDPVNYNPLGGRATYGYGSYTELNQNDINRNRLYDSTLKDRNGNLYDCNSLGFCQNRY